MTSINAENLAKDVLKEKMKILLDLSNQSIENSKKNLWNYIYVIKSGDFYKIGYTYNIKARLESFKTANPNELTIIFSYKVPNAKELEAKLHRIYDNKRYHREWFTLDKQDIEEIKSLTYEHGE